MSPASKTFHTKRLLLTPFARDDIAFLHEHWTNPDVRRYLWDDRNVSLEETGEAVDASIASFASQNFGFWLVIESSTGNAAGFAGLREFGDAGEIELLYGLSPEWWGRGFATEAARAVLAYAFEACGLPMVFAGADPPNRASIGVMEGLGMVFDGQRVIEGVGTDYYVATATGTDRQTR